MNQNKHTPGPWKAQRDLYNTPYPEKGFGIYSEVTHLRLAVIEPALPKCEGHTMEEQEPTARLIAAAPELLEACKYVVQYHREHDSGEGELFGMDFVTTCIAAIAKAES